MAGPASGPSVRLGVVILPELPWGQAAGVWRRAEEMGFDHAWTYDHLAWRSLRDEPWGSTVVTLAAAALVTERIRLGPMVTSPNIRHPVTFAKDLMGLDDVSDGRLTVGLGAGGQGWDATILGQEPWSQGERSARFVEFVEMTDRLLRQPATTYRGRYWTADEARMVPGPVQRPRPPFVIAAAGRRALAMAAAHGRGWVTTGDRNPAGDGPPDAAGAAAMVAAHVRRLEGACEAAGRDPATIDRYVITGPLLDPGLTSPERFRDMLGRYAEAGITDVVVHWPRPTDPFRGDLPTFERCIAAAVA